MFLTGQFGFLRKQDNHLLKIDDSTFYLYFQVKIDVSFDNTEFRPSMNLQEVKKSYCLGKVPRQVETGQN